MPLLKKKSFEKVSAPEFLRDDEEVFYCEITNEIFRGYEEFSERMLLCNSMVWTCSMSGKSNLTYAEALENEENIKKSIQEFPKELRVPILFVANRTQRTCFGDMAEDVFLYAKDRYFIGENVETSFTCNKWTESHVLQVVPATEDELNKTTTNGLADSQEKHLFPPASVYKYHIEHLDADDEDISEIMILDSSQMRRRKGFFSREKCKMFLKQYVEQSDKGVFRVKPEILKEFGILDMTFDKIFAGPPPNFEPSKKVIKMANGPAKKSKQETLAKYLTKMNGVNNVGSEGLNGVNSAPKGKNNLLQQMEKRQEEFQKMKQLRQEEKLEMKRKTKQKNLQISTQLKEWYKPKDDLELEDHKKLPVLSDINTKISQKYLGSALMIMEFVKTFEKPLKARNFFNNGLTIDIMERALLEKEIAGPLADIVEMLLTCIFKSQDEESSEYSTAIEKIQQPQRYTNEKLTYYQASKLATAASKWSERYQGFHLRNLPLYSLTVSEILRLHFLGSGARFTERGDKGRFSSRGGYTCEEDPALQLRISKPHILKALAIRNIAQLPVNDKLEILSCLIDQLLTYANFRDSIEERIEKNRQVRTDLRMAQVAEKKREMEYTAARNKIKKDLKETNESKQAITAALEQLKIAEDKERAVSEKQIESLIKASLDKEIYMGMDRAYNKYFKLESIPGVFVNYEEDQPGYCLAEKINHIPELVQADRNTTLDYIRKVFDEMNTSDKENSPKNSTKKMNGDLNPKSTSEIHPDDLGMCSVDAFCVVHFDRPKTKWRFMAKPEDLDEAIDCLNKRGLREGELQQVLNGDKETLLKFISKTPVQLLNSTIEVEEEPDLKSRLKRGKKKYEDSNFGFPAEMSIDDILESTLIDDILEMEEKIYAGSLGQLLVKDRERWRSCLQNRKYDSFDTQILSRVDVEYEKTTEKDAKEHYQDRKRKKYEDPGDYLGATVEIYTESDGEDHENLLEQSTRMTTALECLSAALAQVAYSVEPKYLKKPLGESIDRNIGSHFQVKNILESWEQSLVMSTSFSQIFLHYNTLDSSIKWSMSTLEAKCKVCRRKKDSQDMLLCDSCNLGHHLYCLKPPLTSVPKGDWFCDRCTAIKEKENQKEVVLQEGEVMPRKKRRIFKDDEEEAEEEEEKEETDEETEEEELEEESSSENKDEDEEEEESEEDEDCDSVEVELCSTCGSGGVLVTCRTCNTSYHKECTRPPLRAVPKGSWTCTNCRGGAKEAEVETNGRSKEKKESDRSERSQRDRKKRINGNNDSGAEETIIPQKKRSFRRESGRNDLPLHNAALQDLLSETMKHPDAWPFTRPVQKNEVPDYYDVISHPMDFGTIKYKLNMGEYNEDSQLMYDVLLIFENCNTYNDCDSDIYECGERLLEFFKDKCLELELKIPESKPDEETDEPEMKKKRRTK